MKIIGLPISLWDPIILRRVGEEYGGFLAIDPQTEKLEELQWARILVKMNGEDLPSALEIKVEEVCYSFSLWWEIRLSLRKASVDSREMTDRTRGEVRGEATAHAGPCVVEEKENAWLEALHLSADGMGGQVSGSGREVIANQFQVGSVAWSSLDPLAFGPSSSGLAVGSKGTKRAGGLSLLGPPVDLKLKCATVDEAGPTAGPSSSKAEWWVAKVESPSLLGWLAWKGSAQVLPSSSY